MHGGRIQRIWETEVAQRGPLMAVMGEGEAPKNGSLVTSEAEQFSFIDRAVNFASHFACSY